jgi:hypothetical protein
MYLFVCIDGTLDIIVSTGTSQIHIKRCQETIYYYIIVPAKQ